MNARRKFIKQTAAVAGAMSFAEFINPLFAAEMKSQADKMATLSPAEAATNEDFWGWVRESYGGDAGRTCSPFQEWLTGRLFRLLPPTQSAPCIRDIFSFWERGCAPRRNLWVAPG